MDILHGKTLLRKAGADFVEVRADDELNEVDVIGFYFSAHWCFPCLAFTPRLATCYKQLRENRQPFEIVFVSADLSDEMMKSYMRESHGDWLAVPPGDELTEELTEKYGVMGVPALVIAKKSGDIITLKGPRDVKIKGSDAFIAWKEGKAATTDDDEIIEEAKTEEKLEEKKGGDEVSPKPPKKKKPKVKEDSQGTSQATDGEEEAKRPKKKKKKAKPTDESSPSVEGESVATPSLEEEGTASPPRVRKKKKALAKVEEMSSGSGGAAEETGELPTGERPVRKKKPRKKPEEAEAAEPETDSTPANSSSPTKTSASSKPKTKKRATSPDGGSASSIPAEVESSPEVRKKKKKKVDSSASQSSDRSEGDAAMASTAQPPTNLPAVKEEGEMVKRKEEQLEIQKKNRSNEECH